MKKWQLGTVVGLAVLVVYQWSTVRSLRAELADRGRLLRECRQTIPNRGELMAAGQWLHKYYQSKEGLQRPQGLWLDDKPDFEGISAWILDVYVWARADGASEHEARQLIVSAIRESAEWRTAHPASNSPR